MTLKKHSKGSEGVGCGVSIVELASCQLLWINKAKGKRFQGKLTCFSSSF